MLLGKRTTSRDDWTRVVHTVQHGGIAVIPTDTVYGIVASAYDRKTVARLYRLRRTTPNKPFVILIDSGARLAEFGIQQTAKQHAFLKSVWPGKVSVILPCSGVSFAYLHHGTKSLAFRIPKSRKVLALLARTGPLVAPSANLEGKPPAENIKQARNYFGNAVDLYISGGRIRGKPSTLVSLVGGKIEVVREGAVPIMQ